MRQHKLLKSQNYGAFKFLYSNREVTAFDKKRRPLRKSLENYGWMPSFPMMVRPNGGPNSYEIIDGQNRFAIAKELGIPFYYVIDETNVDVAEINSCALNWSMRDYVKKYALDGVPDYQELETFADGYGISISTAATLLYGRHTGQKIKRGDFTVENRDDAHAAANLSEQLCKTSGLTMKNAIVMAVFFCLKLDYFDQSRLLRNTRKRPQMLIRGGGRDAYLDCLEDIYNFGSPATHRKPVAFDARNVMAR